MFGFAAVLLALSVVGFVLLLRYRERLKLIPGAPALALLGAVWGAVLGTVLPVVFFRVRAAGNQFWMHDFRALRPIGGAATITGAFSGWLSVLVWRASGRMESPALRWLLRLGTLIGLAVLGLMVGLAWVMVLYWVHALPEGDSWAPVAYGVLVGLIGSVIGLISGACVAARGRSR